MLVVEDVDIEGRQAAASVLGRIRTLAAVAALERLAEDRAQTSDAWPINGLGRIGTPEAAERLRQVASSDESNLNRARASEFLGRMR
jgi:HEAT repeat protein